MSKKNADRIRSQARRDYWATVKSNIGCQVCGETFWACLHWHHVDPNSKAFNVALRSNGSIETIRDELRKCTLVCSNCHRKIEHGLIESPLIVDSGLLDIAMS